MGDVAALAGWMRSLGVALAVVVNERLLLAGLVDRLDREGIAVFGAARAMAARHAARTTAKQELAALGVATPAWRAVEDRAGLEPAYGELGRLWLKRSPSLGGPTVIPVRDPGDLVMAWRRLGGEEPAQIVAEQHVDGDDVAILCLVGRGRVTVLPPVQVFRQRSQEPGSALTEGMGARTLSIGCARWLANDIAERVIVPLIGRPVATDEGFYGALTIRARLGENDWSVLGVDCEWGDPVAQTALAASDVSLTNILQAGPRRDSVRIVVCSQVCMATSVVLVRREYPAVGSYPALRYRLQTVREIASAFVPYDGAAEGESISTSSGRFCSLTATAPTLAEAGERAAADAERIVDAHPELDYNRAVCQSRDASTNGRPRWDE